MVDELKSTSFLLFFYIVDLKVAQDGSQKDTNDIKWM